MTFGFAMLTAGTILILSGYNNVSIPEVLEGAFTKKSGGSGTKGFEETIEQEIGGGEGAPTNSVPSGKNRPSIIGNPPRNRLLAIQRGVAEANKLAGRYPYSWAGGHGKLGVPGGQMENGGPGFDCSGAVSAVLGAMGLISTPMDSTALMSFGQPGAGKWITIYANPEHTFMKIAGAWFGTGSAKEAVRGGPAWGNHDPNLSAYTVRHPKGF